MVGSLVFSLINIGGFYLAPETGCADSGDIEDSDEGLEFESPPSWADRRTHCMVEIWEAVHTPDAAHD